MAANPFDSQEFREEFRRELKEALEPFSESQKDHEKRIGALEKLGAKAAVLGVLLLAAAETGWHKLFGGSHS